MERKDASKCGALVPRDPQSSLHMKCPARSLTSDTSQDPHSRPPSPDPRGADCFGHRCDKAPDCKPVAYPIANPRVVSARGLDGTLDQLNDSRCTSIHCFSTKCAAL